MSLSNRNGCFSMVGISLRLGDAKKLLVLDPGLRLPAPLLAVIKSVAECRSNGS